MKDIDWDSLEIQYRAGVRSLRAIGKDYGLSDAAIIRRAKRDGWTRDLKGKIREKAAALVRSAAIDSLPGSKKQLAETAVVDANAQAAADIILAHRRDIGRARRLAGAMFDELEEQTRPETLQLLRNLAEIMRNPDEKNGRDKLNEIYSAAISLPERSKTMKLLTDSLGRLIELERGAFGLDERKMPGSPGDITISF